MILWIVCSVMVHLLQFARLAPDMQQSSLESCQSLVVSKMLFLPELKALLAGRCAEEVLHSTSVHTPCQERVLRYVRDYIDKKGQEGSQQVLELLSMVVEAAEGISAEESQKMQRARETAHALAEAVYNKCGQNVNRTLEVIERKFGVESEAFDTYMMSCVNTSMDILFSASGQTGNPDVLVIARKLQDLTLNIMTEYAAVVHSLCRITWGKACSFDSMDMTLSRPCFGVVVLLEPGQQLCCIQDLLLDELLLKMHGSMLHMTVFQASLAFDKTKYEPQSLPVNVLDVLQTYMNWALQVLFDDVQKELASQSVKLNRTLEVFGAEYPSHVVVGVDCKDESETLWKLKKRLSAMGFRWMQALSSELKSHGFKGDVKGRYTGSVLRSNGWRLAISSIGADDYKMHVTLGVVKTGCQEYDNLLLSVHSDLERTIDSVFSQDKGDPHVESMMKLLDRASASIQREMLLKTDPNELGDYSLLKSHVERVRSGRKPGLDKKTKDEWHCFIAEKIMRRLGEIDFYGMDPHIRVSGYDVSIINAKRMHKFVPAVSGDVSTAVPENS